MASTLHTLTHKGIEADPRIRGFSILGFIYLRFTAAQKKRKIKEMNGSCFKTRAQPEQAVTW